MLSVAIECNRRTSSIFFTRDSSRSPIMPLCVCAVVDRALEYDFRLLHLFFSPLPLLL